jgi:hypothetical protein
MKNIFIVLGVVLSTAAYATELKCHLVNGESSTQKTITGSEIVLEQTSEGIIKHNRQSAVTQNGDKVFYVVNGFSKRENGCHSLYAALGLENDQSTWINVFADWCQDSKFQVYGASLNNVNLECTAK